MSYDPHPPTGGGGSVTDATISTSDITTNNASAAKHGWLIKLANTATKFLRDDGTWQTIAGGGDALVANPLSQFAPTTSAQLAGVLTDETGSGAAVFATSPTLVTPVLGVAAATTINKVALTAPAAGSTITVADGVTLTVPANANVQGTHSGTSSGTNTGDQTNITGNAATVTTNANLTGPVTSVGNATTIADAELAALAGLVSAADKLPYFTGGGTASLADFTAAARALLDDANAAAMLVTLGALALAGGTMSGAIAMGNNNVTGGKQVTFNGVVAGGNKGGAAPNLADWTAGSIQEITLTSNVTGTPTFTAPTGVSRLTLIVHGATFTMTHPSAVKWAGGAAPTLTTNGIDIFTYLYDGTTYYAVPGLNFA